MKSLLVSFCLFFTLAGAAQSLQQISTTMDKKNRWVDSLFKRIGDKRIVALGEDTHGTAEFYELRELITSRLIKEKGFNTMILENPHEDMMALQQGLQTEKLDTLMRKHLFSIYQTKQMKSFLQWFKKYARKHKGLKLAGCDDSYRELLPNELIKAIAVYNNEELNNMAKDYLRRQTLSMDEYYAGSTEKRLDEMSFGVQTYRRLHTLDSLCQLQPTHYKQVKELLFHAKTGYVFYERYAKKIPVSRDQVMGERINFYAADPAAKIIVWAHNGHVAKYAWLADELGLMGATVLKAYPDDYVSIGISSSEGNYSYMKGRFINNDHDFTDSLFTATLKPVPAGSWNDLLAKQEKEKFFLDFSKSTGAAHQQLDQPKQLKVLGYGKESEGAKDYYQVSLPKMVDVLLYYRKTSQTTPLFN